MIGRHGLNVTEAGRTTLNEYKEYTLGYAINRQDRERMASFQAWQNQMVQAQENIGTEKKPKMKSVYESFNDFYDEEKSFNYIFEPEKIERQIKKQRPLNMADKNRILSKVRKEDANG